jgi:hypothetical protein
LAAYASRTFDFDDNNEQEDSDEEDVENAEDISMDDIKTKLMVLDPKIANDMWFV